MAALDQYLRTTRIVAVGMVAALVALDLFAVHFPRRERWEEWARRMTTAA
jgi:hypothetical protein